MEVFTCKSESDKKWRIKNEVEMITGEISVEKERNPSLVYKGHCKA